MVLPKLHLAIKSGSVQGGGSCQEFHFPGWECCCWYHFDAVVSKVRVCGWGFWAHKRLFIQQGDHKNHIPLILGQQPRCSALNCSPPRGHLEEVIWCLSELALTLVSSAGPTSTGFSASTGGTGTRWRTAHRGKQHVPRLHFPRRSRQPREEAA